MRARAEGRAVVIWKCEDKKCPPHVEEAQFVEDQNGWLFIALFERAGDGAMARLLPQHQVLRVDLPDIVVEASDDNTVWTRYFDVLDKTEVEAGKLEPADFER